MTLVPGRLGLQSLREALGFESLPSTRKPCVSVQEGYERWASTYDCDPNPLLALEERHLRPVLQQFLGRRVLELACGTGRWSAWLVEKGVRCFAGVDFSRAMLARANRKPLLRGRMVLADCHDLPFRNGAFDLVLCSFALGHFQDVQRVAREVARVTVSAGDVIVTDLHPRAYEQGWRTAFRDDLGPVEIATYRRPFDEQLAAWRLAGYRCHHSIAAWLDEREMPIFTQAGKAHIFEEVRHVPAIQILHFKQQSTRTADTEKQESGRHAE